ncbi:ATP-binding protein [Rhizobium gallicum]|uniref:PAS domain-containing sensor histidine kinase n=1 Tax=Rhizobium gallicum TaxID=56730 RepID=UPI001EF9B297|nr:ATP-binding protein [Rhizobium gallicum]ULJ75785.1 ATP-binding protein [Rhizobium gallicum]
MDARNGAASMPTQDFPSMTADAVPILISFFDTDHICRFANEHHCRWYGRTPQELTGLHMREFLGEQAYIERLSHLERVAAGHEVLFEAPVPFLDGSWHDAEIRYIPQIGKNGFEGFHILVVDIERQKHRFRSVFDGTALGFFEIDLLNLHSLLAELKASGVANLAEHAASDLRFTRQVLDVTRVVDLNEKAMEMFGVSRAGAIGRPLGDWCPDVGLTTWNNNLVAYLSGEASYEGETVMLREDGTPVDVLLNCAFPKRMEGQVIVVVGLVDITRRLENERALIKAQQELAHAARIATLGELTASIAHEVNQPLGAVVANGHAALRWLNRPVANVDEAQLAIRRMIEEATRASEIIAHIRKMAKNSKSERTIFEINSVIGEAVEITGAQLRSNGANLVLSLVSDPAQVSADRIQIQQVIINLLVNAAQAMSEIGARERSIFVKSVRLEDAVEIAVSDTGPGFGNENAEQLFNAFFTTKETGMGMGLSISKTIVEAHGGKISASPRDGGGAVFTFTLPLTEDGETALERPLQSAGVHEQVCFSQGIGNLVP